MQPKKYITPIKYREKAFGREGRENKPIYVKVLGDLDSLEALRKALSKTKENDQIVVKGTAAGRIDDYSVLENEVATEAAEAILTGRFKGFGRMDGGLLLEVVSCVKSGEPASITEVFAAGKVTVADDRFFGCWY